MKTIVITGTSTGIGFAAAVSLARAGHDVIATLRNPAKAPHLAELAARERLAVTILPLDVDRDESVAAAFRKILDSRGHVDVLVNNAGIAALGSVECTPLDVFRQSMETNVFGALRCIQAVLPGMRERRSGRIVNIGSVAGRLGSAGQSAYVATKFALEGLSDSLAAEMRAFNVHVNLVEPGVIETPIFGKANDISNEIYPGPRRLNAVFAAALEQPVPASVIGEQIRDIVEDPTWTVRYPGGPVAAAIMRWRASLSDEEFTAVAALDDDAWCRYYEQTFGSTVRSHLAPGAALT